MVNDDIISTKYNCIASSFKRFYGGGGDLPKEYVLYARGNDEENERTLKLI